MTDDRHAAGLAPAAFQFVGRIKVRRDFLAANSGIRVPMPPFILLVKPTGLGVARAGCTVTKRIGNSVTRNRAKRRLREVARLTMPTLAVPSADHIFIARPQETELPFEELLALTRKALEKARKRVEPAP